MSSAYEQVAIANAVARGLAADEVQRYTYSQVGELAGVVISPNGDSPPDFNYSNIRSVVVQYLRDNAATALKQKQMMALNACVALYPDLKGLGVYETADGIIVK